MKITIERVVITGRPSKVMYKLVSEGKTLFTNPDSEHGQSYWVWTKKKDAQRIIDAINENGLEFVEEQLGVKA